MEIDQTVASFLIRVTQHEVDEPKEREKEKRVLLSRVLQRRHSAKEKKFRPVEKKIEAKLSCHDMNFLRFFTSLCCLHTVSSFSLPRESSKNRAERHEEIQSRMKIK